MSRRPAIERLYAELSEEPGALSLDDEELKVLAEALNAAYNAGASSVIGDEETPLVLVNRFIKERTLRFDDAMETSPREHLREFETWRRHARKVEGT